MADRATVFNHIFHASATSAIAGDVMGVGWALPGLSWDKYILGYMQAKGLKEIYPVVPRIKNIGRNHHRNGWAWAGNWKLPETYRWQENRR